MFSRHRRAVVGALAVMLLVATACGSSDEQAEPAVTPSVELLPPATSPPIESVPAQGSGTAAGVAATPAPTVEPSLLSCLDTRQRIGQLLIPLAGQSELFGAQAFAADGEIGGVALLGSPDESLAQDLQALQQAALVPVMVASDEEGGSVQRLGALLGPRPSAAATAQSLTPEEVFNEWREYGFRLRDNGVTVVFGPVVDVGSGPGIESRSFGDDPQVVATYGRAVAEGLLEAGVMPVLKHFPGHGRASADSHLELPTTPPLAEMRSLDLVPYEQLLGDPVLAPQVGVMVGHLAVPGLSDDRPTSLSPEAVTELLRNELGFGGLVVTDAMNMGAIVNTYGLLESLELALVAGADLLIIGSLADVTPALDHLVARADADPALAAIVDNRAERVLRSKGQATLCS